MCLTIRLWLARIAFQQKREMSTANEPNQTTIIHTVFDMWSFPMVALKIKKIIPRVQGPSSAQADGVFGTSPIGVIKQSFFWYKLLYKLRYRPHQECHAAPHANVKDFHGLRGLLKC